MVALLALNAKNGVDIVPDVQCERAGDIDMAQLLASQGIMSHRAHLSQDKCIDVSATEEGVGSVRLSFVS